MKATKMVAVLLLGLPAVSLAVPVTYEFSGNVTFTSDALGLDPDVAVGSAFTGSFTFDDAIAPAFTIPGVASYLDLVSAFDVSFAGLDFTRAPRALGPASPQTSEAQVSNNRPFDGADAFNFTSALAPLDTDPAGALLFRNATFMGVSSNNTTFTDTSLPTTLDAAAFDIVPLSLSVTYMLLASPSEIVGSGDISGRITSVRVANTSVPGPSTLLLLAGGLGLLVCLGRRRELHSPRA